MFAPTDEQILQLAEGRVRLALSASPFGDLFPKPVQATTSFWRQFLQQAFHFIENPQPFFRHRFPQIAQATAYPATHMELTDRVLHSQLR